MPSSQRPLSTERIGEVDDGEIHRTALFLVRVFGAAAPEVAAERSRRSDQAEEWGRVAAAVHRLLENVPRGDLDSSFPLPQT
jgi:hypothetical protein